jgi:hypothetical protein
MYILLVTDPQCPESVRYYRTEGVIDSIQGIAYHKLSIQECLQDHSWAWGRYDAIWLQTYHRPECVSIAMTAQQYGLKVILDDDDLRINTPGHNPAAKYYAHPETKKRVAMMLNMADLIFVSTPHLKKLYSAVTQKRIVVAKNAWSDRLKVKEASDQEKVPTIAWRGSQKHIGDLEEVRVPLSKAFNSQRCRLMFIGATPGYLTPSFENQLPFMPLSGYFNTLPALGIDYLFVPLLVDDFNKCKSNCSAIEALMLAGAAVIAPYGLPEFQMEGVLHYKPGIELTELFEQIYRGDIDKEVVVNRGQQYIQENLSLAQQNVYRSNAIQEIGN